MTVEEVDPATQNGAAIVAALQLLTDGKWHTGTNVRRAMRAASDIQPHTTQNLVRELRNFGAVTSKRGAGGPIVLKLTTLGAVWWSDTADRWGAT